MNRAMQVVVYKASTNLELSVCRDAERPPKNYEISLIRSEIFSKFEKNNFKIDSSIFSVSIKFLPRLLRPCLHLRRFLSTNLRRMTSTMKTKFPNRRRPRSRRTWTRNHRKIRPQTKQMEIENSIVYCEQNY